jgi:hypothetical protein
MGYYQRKYNLARHYDIPDGSTWNSQPLSPQPLSHPVDCERWTRKIPIGTVPETDLHPRTLFGRGGYVDIVSGIKGVAQIAHNVATNPYVQLGTKILGNVISPGAGNTAAAALMSYSKIAEEPKQYLEDVAGVLGTPETRKSGDGTLSRAWNWVRSNVFLQKPAGSIITSDNALQKPPEFHEDVKNEVEAPFGVGSVVLNMPPKPVLPSETLPTMKMEGKIEMNPEGQMFVAPPKSELNRQNIGPNRLLTPQDVRLNKRIL